MKRDELVKKFHELNEKMDIAWQRVHENPLDSSNVAAVKELYIELTLLDLELREFEE